MTSEEIVGASKRLAEEIGLIFRSDSDYPSQDAAALIARQLISCTSQAYEEVAQRDCHLCRAGRAVIKSPWHVFAHTTPGEPGEVPCRAAGAHLLRDRLATSASPAA